MLELNPDDAEAWVRIAECQLQLDLLDAAREALDKALALSPQHTEANYLKKHLGEMTTPHKPGF
jgi:predicted TPR repeat methyltransferase